MDALDQQTQVSISGGMRTTAELECLSPRPATGFHLFVEEGVELGALVFQPSSFIGG